MPVRCTFLLNSKESSHLYCSGFGSVKAFSGTERGRDNPYATALPDVGPLPVGTYYLVDRRSGGTLGWLHDWIDAHGYGTTDRTTWFTLWNPDGGDTTMINGIKRGEFRLHPMGPLRLSHGKQPARVRRFATLHSFPRTGYRNSWFDYEGLRYG